MDDEFVVPLAKLSSLKRYQPRIESLFSVLVEGIRPDDTVIDGSTSDVWIRVKSSRANIATSPQQQQQRCQQDVQNAKEYILSLVDGTGGHEKISYSRDDFEVLRNHHSDIEINSRAVLAFNVNQSSLCIQGQAINRALAQSFIALLLQDVQTPDKVSEISRRKSPPLPKSREDGFRSRGDGAGVRPAKRVLSPPCLSPTADSCYGSSDDCLTDLAGSLLSPPPVPSRSTKPHYMYPDAAPVVSPAGSSSSGSSDSELEKIQADPSYFSKVEFGVKLGYSESQVLNCLQKLGVDAPQNELLSELIKLGETQAIKSMSESDTTAPLDRYVSGQTLSAESGNVSVGENSGDNAGDIRTGVEVEELKETLDKEDSSQRVDSDNKDTVYRHIVIDGSNVAMSHGNKEVFSCEGIRLAVEWFRDRGCRDITVFVPQWRKESSRPDAPIKDQQILLELEKERILSFTPARRIGGKRMVCYDDRYVLNLASQEDGIVVSNDNYRDLLVENKDYKKVVEERLLMYSFVKDKFMPPDDPLGRHGPSLENFLRKEPCLPETLPPPCPYGKKCTYGNKCKFYHPERGNQPQKSVAEKLAEQAKQQMQEVKDKTKTSEERKKGKKQKQPEKRLLRRTDSSTLSSSDPLMPPPRPPRQGRDKSPQKDILELEHNMDNPEYKAYNDRLAELSKNIEDGRGGQRNKANDPLPQVPDVSIDESLGLLRPAWSPTQELVQTRSSQGREQLVTGHLDLAKTLSDEANRENQQKRAAQIRRQQQELKQDLLRQEAQFLSYSSADTESLSQQLQTGLSLQPDSRHHHQTPLSYVDPRLELQRRANSLPVQPVSYGYDQGTFYTDVSPQHLPSYPGAVPRQQQLYDQFVSGQGEELLTERGVTRSSSARSPVPQFSRAPGLSSMTRQNSTSDPLLNKLPDTSVPVDPIGSQSVNDPGYGHFPGMVSERPASQPSFYPGAVPSHPQYGQYAPSLPYHPPSSHAYVSHSPHRSPRPQTHPLHRTGAAGPVGQPHQMLTPPGYTPESGFPPDSPIPPTDKRYSLYYHLCGIFPEPHVRAVMNRYPLETNPRTLCMYIVGIGN